MFSPRRCHADARRHHMMSFTAAPMPMRAAKRAIKEAKMCAADARYVACRERRRRRLMRVMCAMKCMSASFDSAACAKRGDEVRPPVLSVRYYAASAHECARGEITVQPFILLRAAATPPLSLLFVLLLRHDCHVFTFFATRIAFRQLRCFYFD